MDGICQAYNNISTISVKEIEVAVIISVVTNVEYSTGLSNTSSAEYAKYSKNIKDIFQSNLEEVAKTPGVKLNIVTVVFTPYTTDTTIYVVYGASVSNSTDLVLLVDTIQNSATSAIAKAITNSEGTYINTSTVASVTYIYHVSDPPVTWLQASQFCESKFNRVLPYPKDIQENKMVGHASTTWLDISIYDIFNKQQLPQLEPTATSTTATYTRTENFKRTETSTTTENSTKTATSTTIASPTRTETSTTTASFKNSNFHNLIPRQRTWMNPDGIWLSRPSNSTYAFSCVNKNFPLDFASMLTTILKRPAVVCK